ncbi:MAG: PAS domain S-box protein [Acidobacteriota bacterium]|nr:PAS domain S-box protein [Acidobacteriota bacterium]
MRAVVVLALGVLGVANAITALSGAIILSAGFGSSLSRNWFLWWAGDGLGMLIVAPVILTWTEALRRRQRLSAAQVAEAIVLLGCLVAAAPLVLGPTHQSVPSGPYLLFPLMLWAALRFGPVGSATSTLIVAAVSIWYTSLGHGPFVDATAGPPAAILETYSFLAVVGVSSLIAATAFRERQDAVVQLRQSREQYRNVVETATDAIITIDRDSRIRFANAATERIFGYSAAELAGQSLTMLMPPDQRQRHLAGMTAYLASGKRSISWQGTALTGLHQKGHELPLEVSFGELAAAGRHEFTGILRDISEKRASQEAIKSLEEQYRQSQKMEAVGELAGGIAHDFNNLLTVVLANTEMLLDDVGPDNILRPQLEQVQAAGQRAAALTRQLLAFSRRQILAPRVVSLADAVRGIEPMLKRLIGEHVTVHVSTPETAGPVMADPGQIEQVILNLSINARDAMPEGGVLMIEVSERDLDIRSARSMDLEPGRYATLSFSDTGTGIAPDAISRIFDPFFTTKPVGRGTGLGLSTVHGIIKQSGGGIEVSSEPSRGSTFRVYLPRVDAEVDVETQAVRPVSVEPQRATILIVEDEPNVGKLTRRILERGGYRALLAASPSEALATASAEPDIQMLLTDVVLPEMSGRALARRLLETHPDLKVLYMSGYTDDALSQHGVLDPGIALIEKPFRSGALLTRIEAILRGDSEASAKLGAGESAPHE